MSEKQYMTIDGIPVEITGEKNILELCQKIGVKMPTFCYHSDLSIYGACCMCMEPAQAPVAVDFTERFRKDANEEEDECFLYEGKKLPLDHMTLTLVLLNTPMRFDCGTGCAPAVELKPWNEAEKVWAEDGDKPQDTYRPFEGLKDLLGSEPKEQ